MYAFFDFDEAVTVACLQVLWIESRCMFACIYLDTVPLYTQNALKKQTFDTIEDNSRSWRINGICDTSISLLIT